MNAPLPESIRKALETVTLDDKYALESGRAFMSGVQALVRLPMLQRVRDAKQGLNTAGFVSGYRGSPLGGYDQALWSARKHLAANHVVFQPGVNEELAATAIWGTQQLEFDKANIQEARSLVEQAKAEGWDGKIRLLCTNSPARVATGLAVATSLESAGMSVDTSKTNVDTAAQLAEVRLPFCIGTAVADKFVATRQDSIGDLWATLEEQRVEVMRGREVEFVEQIEQIPLSDSVAIVAPGIIARRLRPGDHGAVAAHPGKETENLYVVADADGEPLAVWP